MKKGAYLLNNKVLTFQWTFWQELSPSERLRRSWNLRKRIKNLTKLHDKKIFPQP